jgi:hypothetical protein
VSVFVRLRTPALAALATAAATVCGVTFTAAAATPPVSVALSLTRTGPFPQGTPVPLTAVVRNAHAQSRPATLELAIAARGRPPVTFYAANLIVPGHGAATRHASVAASQWFASTGRFRITASVDGRPSAPVTVVVSPPRVRVPRFEDVTGRMGLDASVPEPSCGRFANGAAWGDVDGDGRPDLYVTRLDRPAELFVAGRDGGFLEQSKARNVAVRGATAAAFADYDNDGHPDLYVARPGPDVLLHNDGHGRFTDATKRAGIRDEAPGAAVAWGDYDGDGFLDLYVTSYVTCLDKTSNPYALTMRVRYFPDVLYRNDGDGSFTPVTRLLGANATEGAGFAAEWFDYDRDNRLDLYLANDFIGGRPDHNHLWRNTGDARGFADVSTQSDTAVFANSMGIAIGDFDRDLEPDIALSDIGAKKLLRNRGDGTFVDVAGPSGVARPQQQVGVPSVTWGVGSYDFNLDGWEDLYFAAGNVLEGTRRGAQPNELFVGTGGRFLDLSAPSGADDPGDSKGLAFADYDRDGRVDVAVVDQGGTARLLRNVTPFGGAHWLEVAARGRASNRDGCGARVVVRLAGGPTLLRQISCSGSEPVAHFGLGRATRVAAVEIVWTSGARQQLGRVGVDRLVTATEPRR